MAKFVNIVAYMHQRMMEAFGDNGMDLPDIHLARHLATLLVL